MIGIFDIGSTANDGTGDSLRKAGRKLNNAASVISAAVATPPGSPSDGDLYIVAASATGDWSGQEDDLAYYDGDASAWEFFTPSEGWRAWDVAEKEMLVFTDGAWSDSAIGAGGGGGGSIVYSAQGVEFSGALIYNNAGSTSENFSGAGQTFDYFDTEAYDEGGWADVGGANPERLTVPAGVTQVKLAGQVVLDNHGTGGMVLLLRKNGSNMTPQITIRAENVGSSTRASFATPKLDVTPGDYFHILVVSEDSNTDVAANACWLAIEEVNPSASTPDAAGLLEAATAAENAAVLQGLIDGGVKDIKLPAGTFSINQVDMASNVRISGQGVDVTTLTMPAQTITDVDGYGGVINVHGTSGTHIVNAIIEDLTIDGNKANITTAGTTDVNDIEGIDFLYADHCHVSRVKVKDTVGDGLDYDNAFECTNRDCEFVGCGGNGNHFSAGSTYCISYNLFADDCGDDNSRNGFDTHASSSHCSYISPRTRDCYRGAYIEGDYSVVVDHHDDASVNNGLRLLASFCSIDGIWKNTVSGNAMTITSGATHNRVKGTAENSGASGFNFLSGANLNQISVVAANCTGTGLILAGDENSAIGCILDQNGINYSNSGSGSSNLGTITS